MLFLIIVRSKFIKEAAIKSPSISIPTTKKESGLNRKRTGFLPPRDTPSPISSSTPSLMSSLTKEDTVVELNPVKSAISALERGP